MKRTMYKIMGLIVLLTMTLQGHSSVRAESRPASARPRVYAYYYLWWSKKHWQDKLGPSYPYAASPLPLPATTDADGCSPASQVSGNQLLDVPARIYSQDDLGVIERDIRAAKAAGLTGFWLNWKGSGSAAQTGSSVTYTPRLAEALAASNRVGGFVNWVSYESYSMPSAAEIINDLNFLHAQFGADPAWERIDGEPVLTFTGSRRFSDAVVAQVSSAVRGKFYFVGDESRATLTPTRMALFDGITYYWSSQDPYGNPQSFNQIKEMGDKVHAAGKRWFAPFTPGYNSILLSGGTNCVPRRNGETMRALWRGNAASNPDGWGLISWNEIAENSHVQPLQKWGSTYLNVLSELINETPGGASFQDVPTSHVYWREIETMWANGITSGCSVAPARYCPAGYLNRAQLSVFNLRANFGPDYAPPPPPWDRFGDDWSRDPAFERWAEGMYNEGLSAGCAAPPSALFCPWHSSTREQAAVFGLRMKYGMKYVPPPARGTVFADMPDPNYWTASWAEKAYADGVLPHCGIDPASGKPLFCPRLLVDRGLAAYIVVHAKEMQMP